METFSWSRAFGKDRALPTDDWRFTEHSAIGSLIVLGQANCGRKNAMPLGSPSAALILPSLAVVSAWQATRELTIDYRSFRPPVRATSDSSSNSRRFRRRSRPSRATG